MQEVQYTETLDSGAVTAQAVQLAGLARTKVAPAFGTCEDVGEIGGC
jgi:hypothetical protein